MLKSETHAYILFYADEQTDKILWKTLTFNNTKKNTQNKEYCLATCEPKINNHWKIWNRIVVHCGFYGAVFNAIGGTYSSPTTFKYWQIKRTISWLVLSKWTCALFATVVLTPFCPFVSPFWEWPFVSETAAALVALTSVQTKKEN